MTCVWALISTGWHASAAVFGLYVATCFHTIKP